MSSVICRSNLNYYSRRTQAGSCAVLAGCATSAAKIVTRGVNAAPLTAATLVGQLAADSVGRVELCNGGVVDWALTALRSAEYPSDLDDIASWTLWNIALCAQGTSTALSADGVVVAVASLRRHLAAIDGAKGDATGATAVWSTVTNLLWLSVVCHLRPVQSCREAASR